MSRILIADDNRELAGLLARSLEREGYSVETAVDGNSLLAGARKNKYNLIILDIFFPSTDGLETLKKLRAEGLETPVLVLGNQDTSFHVLPLNLSANDYVEKPFSFQELAERARAILRAKKIDSLRDEFDALLVQMQTPQASSAMKAAFDASPEELRKAALTAARKRG